MMDVRDKELWGRLFADYLIITAESEEKQQGIVLEWQESLERRGSRVNAKKTDVMVFSKTAPERFSVVEKRGE